MFTWRALALGEDLATALCGAFNAVYFLHFVWNRPEEGSGRRVAAAALALVNLGALAESLAIFLLVLLSPPAPSPLTWVLIRALPFAGTAFISLLILRRLSVS